MALRTNLWRRCRCEPLTKAPVAAGGGARPSNRNKRPSGSQWDICSLLALQGGKPMGQPQQLLRLPKTAYRGSLWSPEMQLGCLASPGPSSTQLWLAWPMTEANPCSLSTTSSWMKGKPLTEGIACLTQQITTQHMSPCWKWTNRHGCHLYMSFGCGWTWTNKRP